MTNDNSKSFKSVIISKTKETDKDAWDYTEKGYIVFLTAFNPDMPETLLTLASESDLQDLIKKNGYGSGHIATCFEKAGHTVIQAGSYVGVTTFSKATQAHLYLGYILN